MADVGGWSQIDNLPIVRQIHVLRQYDVVFLALLTEVSMIEPMRDVREPRRTRREVVDDLDGLSDRVVGGMISVEAEGVDDQRVDAAQEFLRFVADSLHVRQVAEVVDAEADDREDAVLNRNRC